MAKQKKRWFRGVFLVLIAWPVIHMLYACYDGLHAYKGKADIAVVLGNHVFPDSTLSPVLQGRVDRALQLYRDGRVPRIMVSGGKGQPEMGRPPVPEGLAMKLYLVAHGVPADRIIEDNDGENTYLTARDFLPVADSLHIHSAIAVSSFYHLTRTKYIMRKVGFHNVQGVASGSFFAADVWGLVRDCIAFYKYVVVY
ncbi:YdcF family protein [Puia sp.]|jgi:uncharacterized SAM-binding protein YcdF (DUF218 family)|uniref:YdcF family protein n=1 Tax=Puia sp. TaxID=2045100 RepID=UPI002F3F6953